MTDLPIYNCHIHTFTTKHVPRNFLKLVSGPIVGVPLSWALRWEPLAKVFVWSARNIAPFSDNDLIERQARFFETGNRDKQEEIFENIQKQYPKDTKFVVLPMDMKYMDLGEIEESLDEQHKTLLRMVEDYPGQVIPFYAVDPRRDDIVKRVEESLHEDKFRGVKIYPNLGYYPNDDKLMKVYDLCQKRDMPVMTHCTPSGVWQYKLSYEDRVRFSHPRNYERILKDFPNLRLCLTHFGGADEWAKHLKGKTPHEDDNRAWVRWIADLIRSGDYPNLYTDISYTIFMRKPKGLYFDYFDYLKVLLEDEKLQTKVLFGSDYYMVEREPLSEKEVSVSLRSRLGGKLYFQIAHHNPKKYLGI